VSTYVPELTIGAETQSLGSDRSGKQSNNTDSAARFTAGRLSSYATAFMKTFWRCGMWIAKGARTQRTGKRLRVSESVSLGERRFVAVIQVDQERFLIGGSSTSVCMLTRLKDAASFAEALQRSTLEGGLK